MKAIWNERYQQENYQYGIKPNDFFAEELNKLNRKSTLIPPQPKIKLRLEVAKLWVTVRLEKRSL